MADKEEPKNVEEFLAEARKRFSQCVEDEKELRDKFKDDLKFASPDGEGQWDEQLKQQRIAAGRPAMVFPRGHIFVAQVANEARQNKPAIKFSPRLDADEATADIYEGLARYIQYTSDAQVAYETAIQYSAGASFGYYRFLTEYCDYEGDDLNLVIKPVLDPLSVYGVLVPSCLGQKPAYWFVVEDISKEQFKLDYPDSEIHSLSWEEAEKRGDGWVGSHTVRIAEYWWVEKEKVKGKRPKTVIKFCKTNGIEILPNEDGESSKTTWPGTICSVVPVLGHLMIVDGKPKLSSVVRPQKAAQQMLNVTKSRIAETLSLAPISPFIAVKGQISSNAAQWKALNTQPQAVLEYDPVDDNGKPAPPPQRQVFEPPIQSLSAFVAQEVQDMKDTTGIYDASLGAHSNETSGKAIQQREQQSNMSTMHFMDNLKRSFRIAGDIIAELIPIIYDTEREIEILGADEVQKSALINKEHEDKGGKQRHYQMTKGKFVPIVSMEKSFDSKRAEIVDTMSFVIQTNPAMFQLVGDIMLRNMDAAGANEAADRVKKMLPPQLQGGDENGQIPPQAQAMMGQLQQHNQALNAACQQYEAQLKQLEFEKQAKVVDNQAKFAMHKLDVEADIAKAEISTKAQSVQERQAFVNDVAKQVMQMQHESMMSAQEHAQSQQMAAQQAAHAQDTQQQAAEQQAAQSAADAQQQPQVSQ
jgi:hypothetical protein